MFTRLSKTMKIGLGVGGALLFLLIGIAAASPSSAPPVAAPPPPAAPALSSADQFFIDDLTMHASNFGSAVPERRQQLIDAAKADCGWLRTYGVAQLGPMAQTRTSQGYSLAEGLTFDQLAMNHYCPDVSARQAAVVAAPTLPPGSFTDGTYLVGTDMPAGYYVTDGTGSDVASGACYWSRSQNDGGSAGTIIKNSYSPGVGRFTTKAGEVVTLQHGCTWVKK